MQADGPCGRLTHVRKAIVVQIAIIRSHDVKGPVDSELDRRVCERAVPVIPIDSGMLGLYVPAKELASDLADDITQGIEAGDEEILPAILIGIPEPDGKAVDRLLHTSRGRDILKLARGDNRPFRRQTDRFCSPQQTGRN